MTDEQRAAVERLTAQCEHDNSATAFEIAAVLAALADAQAENERLLADATRSSEIERMLCVLKGVLQEGLNDLHYVPRSDGSGHPRGFSVMWVPDWQARQLLFFIQEAMNTPAIDAARAPGPHRRRA